MKRYIRANSLSRNRYARSTSIFAMSVERGPFKHKMARWGELIEEHLCKCVMYGDSLKQGKYNHWIEDELATWLSDCNSTTFKPSDKKLKPADYESLLFGSLGDTLTDSEVCLHSLQAHNHKKRNSYPFVNVDRRMIYNMYIVSAELREKFVPLLASRNKLAKEDIESILHNILDPICLSDK